MDITRAKQILSSPDEIDVTYHGFSVWIKDYNESDNTVSIFTIDNPEDVRIVPVQELLEE